MKPLFSLVIPVYNAEKYLDRLFQSINKQNYKNYEVLIIDDGSTDNTKEICLGMTNKSSRFSYIRQKNSGVSVARNRGLERAKGKYLFFIDADDELMEGTLQQLADTVSEDEKIDILFFGKNNLNKYGKIISTTRMQNCPTDVVNFNLLDNIFKNNLLPITFNKIIKRNFIGDVRFRNISIGEDFQFYLELLNKMPVIKVTSLVLYNYYMENGNSLFKKYDNTRFNVLRKQAKLLYDLGRKLTSDKKMLYIFRNNINAYSLDMLLINVFRKDNTDNFFDKLKSIKEYNNAFGIDFKHMTYPFSKKKKIKLFLGNKVNFVKMLGLSLLYKIK